MAGETGPITVSLPMAMAIAGFFAISIYNTAEILIWIAHTFKRRTSLYFWSLLIASAGIPIHAVGVLLRFFALAPNLPMCVVIIIGWQAMVTGQSVVLFSRLHLVVSNSLKIRWVLVMIVVNYFVLHVPVSVLFLASNSASPDNFIGPFNIYEKIQLAGFSVQETIISGLYLWETVYGLKPVLEIKGADGKRITRHLLLLFIVVVILDSSLMATEYTNNFQIQTTYKPVVYSIKLKIEFVILNELINVTRATSFLENVPSSLSRHFMRNDTRKDTSGHTAAPPPTIGSRLG
ncbi:hypothetical protein GQ53DRAFT_790312 [Thozetella sp. PMI_491]|nr:hypothetical protein GQ53DRAFT_790312 [Thozetella sp. PMI_491]